MSLIHDALQRKTKPVAAVSAVQSPRTAAPAPLFARRTPVWNPSYAAWALTACVCLVFAWSLFTAARFFNVPAADSSPKKEAHSLPQRLPVRTYATVPVPTRKGFMLSGIIEGNEQLAVINDEVVGVGDRIGNALVKEIQGRRVILESNGRDIYLTLS